MENVKHFCHDLIYLRGQTREVCILENAVEFRMSEQGTRHSFFIMPHRHNAVLHLPTYNNFIYISNNNVSVYRNELNSSSRSCVHILSTSMCQYCSFSTFYVSAVCRFLLYFRHWFRLNRFSCSFVGGGS